MENLWNVVVVSQSLGLEELFPGFMTSIWDNDVLRMQRKEIMCIVCLLLTQRGNTPHVSPFLPEISCTVWTCYQRFYSLLYELRTVWFHSLFSPDVIFHTWAALRFNLLTILGLFITAPHVRIPFPTISFNSLEIEIVLDEIPVEK